MKKKSNVPRPPKRFWEGQAIRQLADQLTNVAKVTLEAELTYKSKIFQIHSFEFGSSAPDVPTFALFGGVHGLERIGTHILISYLETLGELARWDESTQQLLKSMRILVYPMVNPGGIYWQTRSNPAGIDLMRNAPIEGDSSIPRWHVFAGHRLTPRLPWFRGNAELAEETQVLFNFVQNKVWSENFSMTLDVHSGFGSVDRLWFPYARTKEPIYHLPEMLSLKKMLDRTYPNHVYQMEPQSTQYRAHGDLWDFLYDKRLEENPNKMFIPLSLEIGSWMWVRKNPRQLLNLLGAFNPILPHRKKRALRRHLLLFDYLLKASYSHSKWSKLSESERASLDSEARKLWL